MEDLKDKLMGTAKVGPKGQIVIPADIRGMFDIKPGDTLILLADKSRGIAVVRSDFFNKMANAVFDKKENSEKGEC